MHKNQAFQAVVQVQPLQSIVPELMNVWYAICIWAQSDAVPASHHLQEIHQVLHKLYANNHSQYIHHRALQLLLQLSSHIPQQ